MLLSTPQGQCLVLSARKQNVGFYFVESCKIQLTKHWDTAALGLGKGLTATLAAHFFFPLLVLGPKPGPHTPGAPSSTK